MLLGYLMSTTSVWSFLGLAMAEQCIVTSTTGDNSSRTYTHTIVCDEGCCPSNDSSYKCCTFIHIGTEGLLFCIVGSVGIGTMVLYLYLKIRGLPLMKPRPQPTDSVHPDQEAPAEDLPADSPPPYWTCVVLNNSSGTGSLGVSVETPSLQAGSVSSNSPMSYGTIFCTDASLQTGLDHSSTNTGSQEMTSVNVIVSGERLPGETSPAQVFYTIEEGNLDQNEILPTYNEAIEQISRVPSAHDTFSSLGYISRHAAIGSRQSEAPLQAADMMAVASDSLDGCRRKISKREVPSVSIKASKLSTRLAIPGLLHLHTVAPRNDLGLRSTSHVFPQGRATRCGMHVHPFENSADYSGDSTMTSSAHAHMSPNNRDLITPSSSYSQGSKCPPPPRYDE